MYHCPRVRALAAESRSEGETVPDPTRVRVRVRATDPVSEAGVASQLRVQHDLEVLSSDSPVRPDVVVLVADRVDEPTATTIRVTRDAGGPRIVLIVGSVDGVGVLAAVEAGVAAIVRRGEATPDRLSTAIRAAATGDSPSAGSPSAS
jgi:AmiR/NasT family two-component response regulator